MAFNQTSEDERDLLSFPLAVARALRRFEKRKTQQHDEGQAQGEEREQ